MRSLAALLVVLLAVSSVAGVGAGHSADHRVVPPNSASAGAPALAAANQTEANATDSDTTEMYLSLRENGNARWNVTQRYVLRGDDELEAFRQLAAAYENGDADLGLSKATFARIVERVNANSDRHMTLRGVSRSAGVRNNGTVGVLTLSFTWTNFTEVRDDKIVLGDAFWTESGTWLPTLGEDQALVISVPGDYYIYGASPPGGTIYNGTVLRYEGPQTFDRGDFSVTYAPKSTENPAPNGLVDFSSPWGLALVVLLFSGGFGAYALSRRRDAGPEPVGESGDATAEPSPAAPPSTDADDGAESATDDDVPDVELLSDEERVLRLLRENDGRMKQGQIVKETNWSNAKVSQLLSKMDDNDDVDKLRIGRENLITLPDEDVTDVE
ncbi:helix-turn-helix transcriptional regulator [Halorussus sp. AFM4]|uniref:helix-turn-helix transcriptional regulator n=1 Tax=Halorussus sp. AFM4 TaxID=3421651 RepID=UPI003EB71075